MRFFPLGHAILRHGALQFFFRQALWPFPLAAQVPGARLGAKGRARKGESWCLRSIAGSFESSVLVEFTFRPKIESLKSQLFFKGVVAETGNSVKLVC